MNTEHASIEGRAIEVLEDQPPQAPVFIVAEDMQPAGQHLAPSADAANDISDDKNSWVMLLRCLSMESP